MQEFRLPLKVKNGNKANINDLSKIREFISKCSDKNGLIDFESLEGKLYKIRTQENKLQYAVIILFNGSQYKVIEDGVSLYGKCNANGIGIIRNNHLDKSTIRHEIGYLIGIGDHHSNCVMSYTGYYLKFCKDCQNKIEKIWKNKQ